MFFNKNLETLLSLGRKGKAFGKALGHEVLLGADAVLTVLFGI